MVKQGKKRGRPKGPKLTNISEQRAEIVVVKETAVAKVENGVGDSMMAVDPQSLIARAIDKNLPVEQMERLLAMRRELKAEWAKERYFKSLAAFQRACPIIGKSRAVYSGEKKETLRYKYAPLDVIVAEVKDILEVHGFSYTLRTIQTAEEVTAICVSHHVDGHSEETQFAVPIDQKAYMNAPQKVASALTYASRYAFRNAFGIMTGDEDDDANACGSGEPPIKAPGAKKADAPIPAQSEPVKEPTPVETARATLNAMYKKCGASHLFTEEELIALRTVAAAKKDDLQSLEDLYAAWGIELDERVKAKKEKA